MRHAIITGIPHGETTPVVVSGPEVPVAAQRAAFKEFQRASEHEEYSEVQLWESTAGIVARRRLQPIEEKKAAKKKAAANS